MQHVKVARSRHGCRDRGQEGIFAAVYNGEESVTAAANTERKALGKVGDCDLGFFIASSP